jgi:hypothetical protein
MPPIATPHRHRRPGLSATAALLLALVAVFALASPGAALGATAGPSQARSPVLAYYYMWFNAASWTHTKTDLPSLGAYDSTDPAIIHQQVAWAKASGVDAFIVSWKNTPALDKALAELVSECRSQGLKLVLIYEGLDVNRNPIPASTVGADILWFADRYGSDPLFDLYGKPAVVWSGSWQFSDAQIAAVRAQVGAPDRLLLLGSEKDAASYQARAALFDGDAYYWSSADPLSTPGYQKRLTDLGAAVHADHGLWLAPAAVGFDARLNGGTTVVDRRDGATLRQAWSDALATAPDGVALISWNEYTENSYVEPSRNFGLQYLQVLASLTGAPGPAVSPGESPTTATAPPATPSGSVAAGKGSAGPSGTNYGAAVGRSQPPYEWLASVLVALALLGALAILGINRRRRTGRASSD